MSLGIIILASSKAEAITIPSQSELVTLAHKYEVNPDLASAIISCEGKIDGTKNNQNLDKDGNVWSTDVGPWQINNYYHETRAKSLGLDIYNKSDNLEYGFILLKEKGLKPWSASRKCWQKLIS